MKAKGWQLAVIVLGIAVGGAATAYQLFGPGEVKLAHEYFLLDVESGDVYHVDSTKYMLTMPAPHPETSRLTLLRISRDDEGKWYMSDRSLSAIGGLAKDADIKAINPSTGDLSHEVKTPIEYRRK